MKVKDSAPIGEQSPWILLDDRPIGAWAAWMPWATLGTGIDLAAAGRRGDPTSAGGRGATPLNRPHLRGQEDATRNCTGFAIIPLVSGDTLGMTVTASH